LRCVRAQLKSWEDKHGYRKWKRAIERFHAEFHASWRDQASTDADNEDYAQRFKDVATRLKHIKEDDAVTDWEVESGAEEEKGKSPKREHKHGKLELSDDEEDIPPSNLLCNVPRGDMNDAE